MTRPSVCRLVKTFARTSIEMARTAGHWLGNLWSRHCDLLKTNASYATTVAAAAASVVTQVNGSDVIAAAITAVVAVWTAVRHPGSRRPRYDDLPADLADLDRWR